MAVVETIVDDLDKSPDATTREFSLGGVVYQIDLVEKNYARLVKAMQPFIDVATPVQGKRSQAPKRSAATVRVRRSAANHSGGLQDIREWARANGRKVSDRGRPSKEVMDAYHKAQGKQATKNGSPALANA